MYRFGLLIFSQNWRIFKKRPKFNLFFIANWHFSLVSELPLVPKIRAVKVGWNLGKYEKNAGWNRYASWEINSLFGRNYSSSTWMQPQSSPKVAGCFVLCMLCWNPSAKALSSFRAPPGLCLGSSVSQAKDSKPLRPRCRPDWDPKGRISQYSKKWKPESPAVSQGNDGSQSSEKSS